MKKEYSSIPQSMAKMDTYGFSWMDFITAIPTPLFVVTSYKSSGKPNACLQSWACFNGEPGRFFAILSCVNKAGHLYQTIKDTGDMVLNFPSADIYDSYAKTITNNTIKIQETNVDISFLKSELKNFLDVDGRLKSYPSKHRLKTLSLFYLASKLEFGRRYTEKELNQVLCDWHTYEDWAMLRRDLYDKRFIDREPNCSFYWMEGNQPSLTEFGLE